jgi:chromodomain-helicase-DNA-binding protein 1
MYWTVKFNGDPNETLETEELEQQFLIKWKGWSHINNTWESEKSIGRRIVKKIELVQSYCNESSHCSRYVPVIVTIVSC